MICILYDQVIPVLYEYKIYINIHTEILYKILTQMCKV